MQAKSWLFREGQLQGIVWIIFSCIFSNFADVTLKFLTPYELPAVEVLFFRMLFGGLVVLPCGFVNGYHLFNTPRKWGLNVTRVVVGISGTLLWILGVKTTSLPSTTIMSFVSPMLVLPLAYFFLHEPVNKTLIATVLTSFLGVIIVAHCEPQVSNTVYGLHKGTLILFGATFLFACSDLLNKLVLSYESVFSMLMLFYLEGTILSLILLPWCWRMPSLPALSYLSLSALAGVGMMYTFLQATAATEISALAPYKYSELIVSIFFGYICFGEVIRISTLVGATIIIASALVLTYYQVTTERL